MMGNSKNTKTKRREFRKKLETWGMPEDEIELCVRQFKENQRRKALGEIDIDAPLCTRASYVAYLKRQAGATTKSTPHLRFGDDYESPDDSEFKPKKVDSVLVGVARATGVTAKAVKRKKAFTRDEYDDHHKEFDG